MFTTDSLGNLYFAAGISVASIPATTGTQSRVLVPGPNGRISSASISQLITQSGGNLVTSVFGRIGAVVAREGDYTTDQITEGQAQYFSNSKARKAINLTTFNTSGPATYDSFTGILNIPQYGSGTSSPTNFVPLTRTITINGQTADLSVDRIFSVDSMVYPPVGIPVSNGTAWGPSITNNSANWNTAYGWGNHASAGYLTSFTETDPIWTADKPNYALKTYVDTSISNLIDTAPSTLNTLNELAAALGDDANFSTTITTLIGTKEPSITAGTTAQYWRGDKTWQTLPVYTLSGLGGVPTTRTLTINGTAYNLSADREWTINSMVYPAAGIAVSTGSAWGTSIVDNSTNWNSAFTDRFKWDGGATGLVAATGRTSLGLGTAATANTGDFAAASHTHSIANVTGLQTALDGKEPTIAAGTTLQYWRGDKTWQTLPTYNLSLYVPYTGATANVDLGLFGLTSRGLTISKAGSSVNGLIFEQAAGLGVNGAGFTTIGPVGTSGFGFYFGGSTQAFYFSATSITSQRTYTLPNASGTLALTSDIVSYTLPIASATILGGIKVGNNLSIDANGILSAGNSYVLPTASATVLGGIKVGTNLSIDANGVLSSTDTNTTYANFTRTVSGLVPNPGGSTTTRYLREDGTWVIPPDTDTVYVHPTTAGNKHIPAGGSAGQILRYSSDGTAVWGADNDTTYVVFTRSANGLAPAAPAGTGTTRYLREDGTWQVPPDTDTDTNTWNANSKDVAGYVAAPGAVANKVWKTDANGNPAWRDDADTDTNTWNANTRDVAGYVSAPGAVANKVWKTDASGNPGWRDDADTDTNTTYTAGAGLTLTGTSFSVTKSIDASQTADTIALRNGSGQLVATGFFQASSRELKTNISPFTRSALDIIREVAVVSFNYKTDVINKHIGFIAEDTPEELSTRNKNVMDSNNTIGVLLKAIQELESKVKELEAKYNEK